MSMSSVTCCCRILPRLSLRRMWCHMSLMESLTPKMTALTQSAREGPLSLLAALCKSRRHLHTCTTLAGLCISFALAIACSLLCHYLMQRGHVPCLPVLFNCLFTIQSNKVTGSWSLPLMMHAFPSGGCKHAQVSTQSCKGFGGMQVHPWCFKEQCYNMGCVYLVNARLLRGVQLEHEIWGAFPLSQSSAA